MGSDKILGYSPEHNEHKELITTSPTCYHANKSEQKKCRHTDKHTHSPKQPL